MPRRKVKCESGVMKSDFSIHNSDFSLPYAVGIDLGGTNIKFGVVSSSGRIVRRAKIPTLAAHGPKKALRRIIATIRRFGRDHDIAQVGIGVAGLIDHKRGIIRLPPNLPGWDGTPVKETIEKATGIPATVGNDVNACALGEFLFGAGRGKRDVFCLTLGTGIGGGIIANGRLVIGANQSAGEVGHTTIFPDGQMCKCGSRGCLECYAGAEYIVQRAIALLRTLGPRLKSRSLIRKYTRNRLETLTTRTIARAARAGDPLALDVIRETGYYVGLGIANVIHLLDPEVIIIGGGVSGFGKPLLAAIQTTVDERIARFEGWKLEIRLSELGDDAGVLGASQLRRFV
jgi:glucokinase